MIIRADGPGGNALSIMSQVAASLKEVGHEDEIEDTLARMRSGDYTNLCQVASEVTHGSIQVGLPCVCCGELTPLRRGYEDGDYCPDCGVDAAEEAPGVS